MSTYAHLPRYTRPPHFADYADIDRAEYFIAYSQHRDSDSLTRSNFRSILQALGGESETVLVLRDSHFAVGWVEAIYVHESDTVACAEADRILGRLEDYPVADEEDHSSLEWDEACEYWAWMNLSERVRYLSRARLSPFAARRDELPEDPNGRLFELLTGV